MTKIYFNPRLDRKKELSFFNFVSLQFKNIEHIKSDYSLPISLFTNQINVQKLSKKLIRDNSLPTKRKLATIEALQRLPQKINVAESIKRVSVDFAIELKEALYFIEFHEIQHRSLPGSKPTKIFCDNDCIVDIPRFSQRLLKDVWRWHNLNNFTVIWWDWFEANKNSVNIQDLLTQERKEFFLNDKFSFSKLLQ